MCPVLSWLPELEHVVLKLRESVGPRTEKFHLGFQIYTIGASSKKSQTSLDLGDLHLKVKFS